jgi:hypothetical protein
VDKKQQAPMVERMTMNVTRPIGGSMNMKLKQIVVAGLMVLGIGLLARQKARTSARPQ